MIRILSVLALVACMSGCATIDMTVSMPDLDKANISFLTDKTPPESNKTYVNSGSSNIFSCRYGILQQTAHEFVPPKAQMFGALLAKSTPAITKHKVVLTRFDVYTNLKLSTLQRAGMGMGGLIGGAIAQGAEDKTKTSHVFSFQKLIVDTDPLNDRLRPNETVVGCENAHEGEYYASDINPGYDAIVTWISFTVDEVPYLFKTLYQIQSPPTLSDNSRAEYIAQIQAFRTNSIRNAISLTIQAIGSKLTNL